MTHEQLRAEIEERQLLLRNLEREEGETMGSMDRHPRTTLAAWDHLLQTLEDQSVCYKAGQQPDADLRPLRSDGVNCGQAVCNAVETLQDTGYLTRAQILAIAQLCKWVALAARA